MHDNMNNYTAILDGCSFKTEEIENMGLYTFVSADSGMKRVIIEEDVFGGISEFIGADNRFFIIKYMGKMPKITYQYHFNDTDLGTIFEIDPSGDTLGTLTFLPNDDSAAGSTIRPVSLAIFDEYSNNVLHDKEDITVSSVFAVHSFIGESYKDGIVDNYIGIDVYSKEGRTPLLKVVGNGLIMGGISKRIVLTLGDTTKLESFSMGELKMFEATTSNQEELSKRSMIVEMLDNPVYSGYYENIKRFKKMINYPNKIFNIDSQI